MDMKMGKILCLVGVVFGVLGILPPFVVATFVIGGLGLMSEIGE